MEVLLADLSAASSKAVHYAHYLKATDRIHVRSELGTIVSEIRLHINIIISSMR